MASAWDAAGSQSTPGNAPVRPRRSAWESSGGAPLQVAQADDPGMMESILIGSGRTFDRVGKGMQQMYYGARSAMHQPTTADLVTNGNEWDRKSADLAASAAEDDRAYATLQAQHPYATGFGEALPSMVIPGGGAKTLGQAVLRQAVAGAVPNALEYGSATERAQRAGLGAVAGAAVPLAGAAIKTAYAAAEPFMKNGQNAIIGRTLNRAAGDDAATVALRMRGASPVVPGSYPTAGQVAENGGIAALERSSAAVNPTDFAERSLSQVGARREALQRIAGSPGALESAQAMRDEVANATYGLARKAGPDPAVFTPEAQANIAAMQSRVPASALDYARSIATLKGEPMDNSSIVSGMQYTKQALNDLAKSPSNGPAMQNALLGLSSDFNNGLRQISPLHGAADDIYSSMSEPINQMAVGRALYERAVPALGRPGESGAPGALSRESANNFAAALDNPGPLVNKATGGFTNDLSSVLTPDQMSALNGVRQDLARTANAQDLGRGVGSDTVQKLAMQNIASQSGMPGAMGLVTKIGGKPLDWLYGDVNADMQRKLANALLNPQQGAGLMQGAVSSPWITNPLARQLLGQSLQRSGLLLSPATTAADSVLTPALSAQ